MPRDYLGEFEHVVLLAVLHTEPEAHGAAIRRSIRERTARGASLGAVYATLRRLEAKGHVAVEEVPSPRGGRPRRLARVTSAGLDALQRSRRLLENMAEGLEERLTREA